MKLKLLFACLLLLVPAAPGRGYTNLSIAVYFRCQEVRSIPADLERFSNQWLNVEKQVKVDKVYLETTRNAQLATDSDVATMKKFFAGRGIKTSGGLGLTANEPNGYQIRTLLGHDLFVGLNAPDHVSLFAYDNRTFIIQNYQSQPVNTRVSVVGAQRLRDLLTTLAVTGTQSGGDLFGGGRGNSGRNSGTVFDLTVPAHSFRVLQAEGP